MPTKEEEIELLKANSPYSLPDNPSQSGWSTGQIKEKFYKGLLILYEFLDNLRSHDNESFASVNTLIESILSDISKIIDGTTIVEKASKDSDGNVIKTTYATKQSIIDGTLPSLKYVKSNGDSENISAIESRLIQLIQTLQGYFTNGVANSAAISVKATQDSNGNTIATYYASKESVSDVQTDVAKIKNGQTTVDRTYKDSDGRAINSTYVKKEQIVNNLTDTSTDKPLGAGQGKELKSMIDGILQTLESPDTNLDTLREIVAYVKNNKGLIDSITTTKISYSDIVTNYTTNVTNKPLAASVGVLLKTLIDGKIDNSYKTTIDEKVATRVAYSDLKVIEGVVTDINVNGTNRKVASNVSVQFAPLQVNATTDLPSNGNTSLYLVKADMWLYGYRNGSWQRFAQYNENFALASEVVPNTRKVANISLASDISSQSLTDNLIFATNEEVEALFNE